MRVFLVGVGIIVAVIGWTRRPQEPQFSPRQQTAVDSVARMLCSPQSTLEPKLKLIMCGGTNAPE